MTSEAACVPAVARVGFWSAVLTALFCILFTIAAVLTEAQILSSPWNVLLPLAPSLFLAPSFLAMMVSVNALVPTARRIWSQLGVAFACVYVPLCAAAYIVEIFVVEPRVLRGETADVALLTLVRGDSVFNAIDGIGYVFMCLATLVTSPAFDNTRPQRWIRWLFAANGALVVPIFMTYFVDRGFMWFAAPWSVTISVSAILLAVHFRQCGARQAARYDA